jgi:hypothetical protein
MLVTRAIFAAPFLLAATANAQPPANADPTLAPWFQSLQQPRTGASCCSISDCRPVEYRSLADHYEALIEGKWLTVPSDKVLQRTDNPIGRAIVCWTPSLGIMCFVRGSEA